VGEIGTSLVKKLLNGYSSFTNQIYPYLSERNIPYLYTLLIARGAKQGAVVLYLKSCYDSQENYQGGFVELAHDTRCLVSQVKNKRKLVNASQHIQVVKIIRRKEGRHYPLSGTLLSRPGREQSQVLGGTGIVGRGAC